MNNKTCIIYNCHIINNETLNRFHKLQNDVKLLNIDVLWGIDNTQQPNINLPENINFFIINEEILNENNDIKFIPKICRFPAPLMWTNSNNLYVLTILEKYPQYQYIWQIEYDVCYTGNWKDFFKDFINDDSDFIATQFIPYNRCIDWCWWAECGHEIPSKQNWWKSLNVLMRLSSKQIHYSKDFYKKYNQNNQIFFEFGLISSSKENNLTSKDIFNSHTSNIYVPGKTSIDYLHHLIPNKLYHGISDNINWNELMIHEGIKYE